MMNNRQGIELRGSNADSTRALTVHLLHECIAARAQIAATRRLVVYACQHNGVTPTLKIDVSMDVAERALTEAIGSITEWLRAQVVALHNPVLTTHILNGTELPDSGEPVAGY